jgi:hypothetical protein
MAQKLPDYGFDRVRVTLEDRVLQFETTPLKRPPVARPELWYFWYSANQLQRTQGGYSGKLLNGSYRSYFLNKNLMEEGFFRAGLKNGIWKIWKENGVLAEEASWQDGIMTGPFSKYDEAGELRLSGRYKNGLMNGPVHSTGGKDSPEITTWYKAGKITEHKPLLKRIHLFRRKRNSTPAVAP